MHKTVANEGSGNSLKKAGLASRNIFRTQNSTLYRSLVLIQFLIKHVLFVCGYKLDVSQHRVCNRLSIKSFFFIISSRDFVARQAASLT